MTSLQVQLMQDIRYHVWQQMIILFLLDPRKFIYIYLDQNRYYLATSCIIHQLIGRN